MPDQRIRYEVDTRFAGLSALNKELRNTISLMGDLAAAGKAAEGAAPGLLDGGRGAGGGHGAGGAGGHAGARGLGGALSQQLGRVSEEIAMLAGAAALASPALALRDASRFGLNTLRLGQQQGLNPAAMSAWSRNLMHWGSVSGRYAFDKNEVLRGAANVAQESQMTPADRTAFFNNPEKMNRTLRVARLLGMEPAEAGTEVGQMLRTFNLGPESVDKVAEAFYKGAKMSGLPNRADFVKYATAYASQFNQIENSMEKAIAAMAAVQSLVPRAFKGQDVAETLGFFSSAVKQYAYHAGEGMSPYMLGIARRSLGRRGEIMEDPVTAQLRLMTAIAQDKGFNAWARRGKDIGIGFLASQAGMSDDVAETVFEMWRANSPEKIRQVLAGAEKKMRAQGGLDKEYDQLAKEPILRAASAQVNAFNEATRGATEALDIFRGNLSGTASAGWGAAKLGAGATALSLLPQALNVGVGLLGQVLQLRMLGRFLGGIGAAGVGAGAAGGAAVAAVGAGAGAGAAEGAGAGAGAAEGAAAGFGLRGLLGRFTAGRLTGTMLTARNALTGDLVARTLLVGQSGRAMEVARLTDMAGTAAGGLGKLVISTGTVVTALVMFADEMRKMTAERSRITAKEQRDRESAQTALADIRGKNPYYRKHRGIADPEYQTPWQERSLVDWVSLGWDKVVKGNKNAAASASKWWTGAVMGGSGTDKMIQRIQAGEGPGRSGHQISNTDNSNITITVSSAAEAADVAARLQNEKLRRQAQLVHDRRLGVDTSAYYSPYTEQRRGSNSSAISPDLALVTGGNLP